MSKRTLPASLPLPRWLVSVASAIIVFHFSAVVVQALAVPSGPWPIPPDGSDMVRPPQFAVILQQSVPGKYLEALRLNYNYHFPTNHPSGPAVNVEFRLEDADGKPMGTITLPDPNANAWVQHRQKQLAASLGMDVMVTPPQMERVPAPHQQAPKVQFWEPVAPEKPNDLYLKTVDEHEIPRTRPVMRPSDLSMMWAHAYVRYLRRTYGAARVQIIRHHQDPIPPAMLFIDPVPPESAFEAVHSNFGELTK